MLRRVLSFSRIIRVTSSIAAWPAGLSFEETVGLTVGLFAATFFMPSSSIAIFIRLAVEALGFTDVRTEVFGMSVGGDFTTGGFGAGRRGWGVGCIAIVSSLFARTVEKS